MIRKATLKDVKKMQKLINYYAKRDEMLPRSLSELYENIRDFFVYGSKGKVAGCAALHLGWEDLAEVKSLAVASDKMRKGIGSKLLKACIKEARWLKVKRLFALTYKPQFFAKHGFKRIDKKQLPQEIWSECIKCVKFPKCDEIAMLKRM
ncbi:MAG: N-acetyltransferase [Candidatus Omnitrophica bacterium]|nr:N-acetyltransferase [Candidatus Omnitrophota bacterium]